jgi:hypothetical protein
MHGKPNKVYYVGIGFAVFLRAAFFSSEKHGSFVWAIKLGNTVKNGSFSRAVWPYETKNFFVFNGER